ncbi:conserved hypothetical protein [Histoplasma capsulatum G186AR]|uniref:Uncharacterized protein n=2 Tax=Ajellomyces capsulatus TaxID=5037 RepID=C0NIF6_AJECG|nr:uncharacterized protein HCBG_02213 [Histoplasma capsulatum G186AR]EEH08676.1 conserved hypothetical protein [Histoplasma capsulatum G186AR]KAG5304013.1 hypothetical protein I7I52_02200 [Histoplasma capsulatum]QSS69612.1 hypothetical protein I7I50_10962 [Histoplasma capsulatum G186AR]
MHGHNHFHRRAPPVDAPNLLLRRAADADSSSSADTSTKTCGPEDTTGRCERPASDVTTTTLPIVLGVVIPLTIAILVLVFLHRRHIRKLRSEDANDKHKSLDFGLDVVPSGNKKRGRGRKGGMEMTTADAEKSVRRNDRGLSMDITMTSPYLLPPALNGSHDSLHSLSRSVHADDDRYRTATAFSAGDNASMRSFTSNLKPLPDDSASFTGMSSRHAPPGDEMHANLLRNAQRMSRTSPPPGTDTHSIGSSQSHRSPPRKLTTPTPNIVSDRSGIHSPDRSLAPKSISTPGSELRKSNDYLGALIQRGTTPETSDRNWPSPSQGEAISQNTQSDELYLTSTPTVHPPSFNLPDLDNVLPESNSSSQSHPHAPPALIPHPAPTPGSAPVLPRISLPSDDDHSDYGDDKRNSTSVLPQVNVDTSESNTHQPDKNARLSTMYDFPDDQGYTFDSRRLTVGIRPLPPEDPSDNPEQRANRIRSFYKEYFDESNKHHPPQEEYYEDYGENDYHEDMPYDPAYPDPYYGGSDDMGFYPPEPPPFTQPMGRRAMTPPPRMPPNFYTQPSRQQGASSAFGYAASHRTFSTTSGDPGPRANSSISNRGPPMPQKPQLRPPGPLHVLPSAHKLKDDTMVLPIDYAPGPTASDRRAGRSGTPRGGLRPYVPVRAANIALASSYDDLAAMPSPHALRKSSTFTALDFAPPPRFRNAETASDAGSIRSNRTGVSAAHAYHIRNGGYRISRLPPETVGTVEDITSNLKPTWDMKT